MASYVVKVQNKGSIRRLTLAGGEVGFSFERLQSRVRELFQLPTGAQFELTYVDKDGDIVTMAEDEDLRDALVVQSLNPLRVTVENAQKVRSDDGVKTSFPIIQTEVDSGVTVENAQEGRTDDGVKTSSPIIQTEADSGVTVENAQEGRTDDGVKTKSPIIQTEADYGEVTEQQQRSRDESIGEAIVSELAEFESSWGFDAVAPAEPVRDSGRNSIVAEEKASALDGAPDSNPADASPATPGAVEDAKEISQGKSEAAKDNSTRVLHQGVQCDVCGMVPIAGPRFISATRYNYDLCHSCFEKSGGNSCEYRRLDRPFVRHCQPLAFTPLHRLVSSRLRQSPLCRRWIMVPNQIFPLFAIHSAGAAHEKTPAVAAGNDVKVGGHPVDVSHAESAATEGTSSATPVAHVDADATTTSGSKQELGTREEQGVDSKARSNVVEIPVIFSTEEANTQTPAGEEDVPSTEIGTETISGETAGVEETSVEAPVEVEENSSTNEDLVAKLATMGFEDSKLNAELLEKNNFDLRKTVDDLCAAEEWDPILGELQEMGFYDANMNRRLMFKNNGSVKRVVKELVQMYKEKLA